MEIVSLRLKIETSKFDGRDPVKGAPFHKCLQVCQWRFVSFLLLDKEFT